MDKFLIHLTVFLLLVLTSCSHTCDYATYNFNNEREGFQLILHSSRNNRIEIIGRNYVTNEFWSFNEGDYVEINKKYKLIFSKDLKPNDSEESLIPDSLYAKYKEYSQHNFMSNELTNEELVFLLKSWITEINIKTEQKTWHAELTSDQSENFRQIFNCLYQRDNKQSKEILKK